MNFHAAQTLNRKRTIWLVIILTGLLVATAWVLNAWILGDFFAFFGGFGSGCGGTGGFSSLDHMPPELARQLGEGQGASCQPASLPFILTPAGTAMAALLFAVGTASFSYYWGDRAVLYVSSARPANPAELKEKQFINVAKEMSIAAGLPLPTLWVLPDTDLNAFATGRDPARSAIAVTEGLLDQLSRDELQAVVAHEMGHIRNRDTLLLLFVTCMLGVILLLTEFMVRGARHRVAVSGGRGGKAAIWVAVATIIIWFVGRFFARVAAMAVSREREYLADATSAELTRNPQALSSALQKIHASVEPTRLSHPATAPMFIDDPRGSKLNEKESRWAALMSTHPPIASRIRRLDAMAFARVKRERMIAGLDPLTGTPGT